MITCYFEKNEQASLRHVTVDCLVLQHEKILLVKRHPKLLEGNKWGLVGGFVDRDETTKQAVNRETLEETGYTIKNITLLTVRDNPNRPHEDRQNISFIYFCEALEQVVKRDWENIEMKWFNFDELPKEEEFAFDHYKNIELYLKYKKEKLTLPII